MREPHEQAEDNRKRQTYEVKYAATMRELDRIEGRVIRYVKLMATLRTRSKTLRRNIANLSSIKVMVPK